MSRVKQAGVSAIEAEGPNRHARRDHVAKARRLFPHENKLGTSWPTVKAIETNAADTVCMPWHCISPPHSEDVIWAAQLLTRHGITDPRAIKTRLEAHGWEIESIEAVICWVGRYQRAAGRSNIVARSPNERVKAMKYSIELAALAGAAVVSAAILLTGRWEITSATNPQMFAVYRIDRWTGEVSMCDAKNDYRIAVRLGFGFDLRCSAGTQAELDALKNSRPSP